MEVKYRGPSPEERIAARLRNSGDARHADVVAQHGEGPTRTFTNVHHYGSNHAFLRKDESAEAEKDTDARAYNSPERGE